MVGANAPGNIAGMADVESVRQEAVVKQVRSTVSANEAMVQADDSVAIGRTRTDPEPATIGLLDFGPEPINEGSCTMRAHVEPRFRCATPPAVDAARGLLVPQLYRSRHGSL